MKPTNNLGGGKVVGTSDRPVRLLQSTDIG